MQPPAAGQGASWLAPGGLGPLLLKSNEYAATGCFDLASAQLCLDSQRALIIPTTAAATAILPHKHTGYCSEPSCSLELEQERVVGEPANETGGKHVNPVATSYTHAMQPRTRSVLEKRLHLGMVKFMWVLQGLGEGKGMELEGTEWWEDKRRGQVTSWRSASTRRRTYPSCNGFPAGLQGS